MRRSPLATVRSAVLSSPESYYLHLAGAQQGPYTIPQVDHLLNSGLIGKETLYWCEGLDQWQPVTSLVAFRTPRRWWIKPLVVAITLVVLAIPARIFGPALYEGWKEANQHEFSAAAAYWRAREVIRTAAHEQGRRVEFGDFASSSVTLQEPTAEVQLHGAIVDPSHHSTPATWSVALQFNPESEEWVGKQVPPTQAKP